MRYKSLISNHLCTEWFHWMVVGMTCMYACMYYACIYTWYACIYTWLHTYMHVYVHDYMYIYMTTCLYACIYMTTCIYTWLHACIHDYMYVCMTTCMHACIYTYHHERCLIRPCSSIYPHTTQERDEMSVGGQSREDLLRCLRCHLDALRWNDVSPVQRLQPSNEYYHVYVIWCYKYVPCIYYGYRLYVYILHLNHSCFTYILRIFFSYTSHLYHTIPYPTLPYLGSNLLNMKNLTNSIALSESTMNSSIAQRSRGKSRYSCCKCFSLYCILKGGVDAAIDSDLSVDWR